jgi:hypothetical protein
MIRLRREVVVTDDELLAFWREKRGNPYLTMATARKLDSLDKKYDYLEPDGQRNLRRAAAVR